MPEAYSEAGQTPKVEHFLENSHWLSVVNYFHKKLHLK